AAQTHREQLHAAHTARSSAYDVRSWSSLTCSTPAAVGRRAWVGDSSSRIAKGTGTSASTEWSKSSCNLKRLLAFFRERRLPVLYLVIGSKHPDFLDILRH